MTKARFVSRAVVIAAAFALQTAVAGADDILKLAVGQRGNWDTAVSELGQRAGMFAKHGVRLEIIYTQGTGETLQAVIAGSVDIGVAVGTSGALGAFAKGAPIRAIGSASTGSSDLFWYVPAPSPIKTIQDAAGKQVAFSTNGSSTHTTVLGIERHANVKFKLIGTGSPTPTFTMVMSGQVDVGWSSPPFALDALSEKKIRILARGSDVPELNDMTVRLLVANASVFANRSDVIVRFMRAYREALDWMYDDPAALKAYSAWVGMPEELTRQLPIEFYPKNMMLPERISGIDKVMADAVTFKYLPAPLTNEKLQQFFQIVRK